MLKNHLNRVFTTSLKSWVYECECISAIHTPEGNSYLVRKLPCGIYIHYSFTEVDGYLRTSWYLSELPE